VTQTPAMAPRLTLQNIWPHLLDVSLPVGDCGGYRAKLKFAVILFSYDIQPEYNSFDISSAVIAGVELFARSVACNHPTSDQHG